MTAATVDRQDTAPVPAEPAAPDPAAAATPAAATPAAAARDRPGRPATAVPAGRDRAAPATPILRCVRPDDVEDVRRFLAGLSLESSYRRFFTGIGRIPDRFVRRFVDVDHDRREAMVAVAGDDVVGLADYALLGGGREAAEFGVVVADGWQRRGLGPRLVTELLALADGRGVTTVRVHVLAENARVQRLLHRRWPAARPTLEDNLLIWDLPL
jgi:ribosomal protein S18 acetylase RimI-like enzyme